MADSAHYPSARAFGDRGRPKEFVMSHYASVFLVIALIAALFGFGGIAAGAMGIAKILFLVFGIMASVAFIVSFGRKGQRHRIPTNQ